MCGGKISGSYSKMANNDIAPLRLEAAVPRANVGPAPGNGAGAGAGNGGLAATLASGTAYRDALRAAVAADAPLIPFDILKTQHRPAFIKLFTFGDNAAAAALREEIDAAYKQYTKKLLKEYRKLEEEGAVIPIDLYQEIHGKPIEYNPNKMNWGTRPPPPVLQGYAVTHGPGANAEHIALVENIRQNGPKVRQFVKKLRQLEALLPKLKLGITDDELDQGETLARFLEISPILINAPEADKQYVRGQIAAFRQVSEELKRAKIADIMRDLGTLTDGIMKGTATPAQKTRAGEIAGKLRPIAHTLPGGRELLLQYDNAENIFNEILQFVPRLDGLVAKRADQLTEEDKIIISTIYNKLTPLLPRLDGIGLGALNVEITGKLNRAIENAIQKNIGVLDRYSANLNAERVVNTLRIQRNISPAISRLTQFRPGLPQLRRLAEYEIKAEINKLLGDPTYVSLKPRLLAEGDVLTQDQLDGFNAFVNAIETNLNRLFDDPYKARLQTLVDQLYRAIQTKRDLLAKQRGKEAATEYRKSYGYGGKSKRRSHTKKHKKHGKKTRKH
jgi:hypothetical protein